MSAAGPETGRARQDQVLTGSTGERVAQTS